VTTIYCSSYDTIILCEHVPIYITLMWRYYDLSLQGTAPNRRHTFGKSERFKNVVDPLQNRNNDIYSRWLYSTGTIAKPTTDVFPSAVIVTAYDMQCV